MNSRNPTLVAASVATACLWLLALVPACSKREAPPAQTQPQSPAAAPEQPVQSEPPATSTESVSPAQPLPDKTTPTGAESATPAPTRNEPAPAEPGSVAPPAAVPPADAPPAAVPPPEPVATEEPVEPVSAPTDPPRSTHAAVGSEKCKMCHRLQYESWSTSAHAKAAPPIGCETCHGNGADYVKITVMKDPALAKAAGLVLPDKAFCTAKCHKPESFTDEMLRKAHAHKVK